MIKKWKRLIVLLLGLNLLLGEANLWAEQDDPDIIDIWGSNFGRLSIALEVETQGQKQRVELLKLKKTFQNYLRWSGLFDLKKTSLEADLILTLRTTSPTSFQAIVRSAEDSELYQSQRVPLWGKRREHSITELVEEIIYQLTGQKSILRSAVVFVEKGGSKGYRLVLTDPFGKHRRVLVNDGELNLLPRWKGDARSFLYTSLRRLGSQLMRYDFSNGTSKVLIQNEGTLSGGSWNAEGDKLVVSLANQGNSDLFLFRRGSKKKERLTFRSSIESNPSLSPDGTRLLFASDRSGSIQIYQRNLLTGETYRMTFEGNYNVEPRWSLDGNYIVYAGIKKGKFQIFFMDKDGIVVRQLTDSQFSSEQPVWSPDGRQIMYLRKIRGEQKLFIMRIDGSFKRRLTNSGRGISEFNPAWTAAYKWPAAQ
ncbi:MAG: hypothetical protein COB67_07770 [SAR324 cluster bacterium]|uniref:Tol-Pal system beta propeller repeat protein TolB n=1 Tax=SAR324 cluster bacterium TaxID=2024889 RepID=A0A2A4T3B9_9DELT|nr:MAG: hypothetical protein COB67_07770 [SAR324 cluster bacterium]